MQVGIKYGGRKKGTPNKISSQKVNLALEAIKDNPGSDPLQFLASIVADERKGDGDRISCAKELAK